ncbi:MAG: hypothetical protein MUQ10_04405 [Anaerolineae bacterium]|nr:hypothetical protein [Anaerolineae bacterium]
MMQMVFPEPTTKPARLALDTIYQRPAVGIPSWMLHVMEHSILERLAGARPGDYIRDPERVYLDAQTAAGTCWIDQYIPENPLTIRSHGYDTEEKTATQGADEIIVDGLVIDSPEAVVEHIERFVIPGIEQDIVNFDEDARVEEIITEEIAVQEKMGPSILKSGYAFIRFPTFSYGSYGYTNYFMAYALYPDVIERQFSIQADYALLNNRAAARAYTEAKLPPLYRLDFDMADSRGLLVRPSTLDRIWLPHFARCLDPMLKTDVRMIWHCDGNLMDLVPRLLDVGIRGFQGFQYEDGMDYEKICKMKTKEGDPLVIVGGVSVTRTLPMGTPSDVKREIDWLVENGPETGLFLGGSSSIAPGVPWENIQTMVDGLRYYREHGRK